MPRGFSSDLSVHAGSVLAFQFCRDAAIGNQFCQRYAEDARELDGFADRDGPFA